MNPYMWQKGTVLYIKHTQAHTHTRAHTHTSKGFYVIYTNVNLLVLMLYYGLS